MALIGTITVATTILCLVLVNAAPGKAFSEPQTCCTSYTRSPIPFHRITGIKTQTILENCDLDAIIFYTVKKNQICANARDPWVRRILSKLSDQLKKMAKARPAVDKNLKIDKSGNHVKTSASGGFFSTTESSQNITENVSTFSSVKALV